MYIRMGPQRFDSAEKPYIHLDAIILPARADVDKYIKQIEQIRDALWPSESEEGENE